MIRAPGQSASWPPRWDRRRRIGHYSGHHVLPDLPRSCFRFREFTAGLARQVGVEHDQDEVGSPRNLPGVLRIAGDVQKRKPASSNQPDRHGKIAKAAWRARRPEHPLGDQQFPEP